jgi:hypothetical protein
MYLARSLASERSGALLYGPRPRAKYKRAVPVRKIASNRVPCAHFSQTSYRAFPFRPSSLLLIAGRKSWIELLRVLFLDGLVWYRLRVRTPRRSCRRICGADGLTDLTGGVRSVRLTGGVYRRGSGRRTYAG